MITYVLGLIHLASFVMAGIGTIHQISLIWKSKAENKSGKGLNTTSLSVKYRGNTVLLLLCMILWGLSLEPIEWLVIFSRGFTLVGFTLILCELWYDRRDRESKYWCFFCVSSMVMGTMMVLFGWDTLKNSSAILGAMTLVLCLNLLWGLWDKVYKIIEARSPGQQSLLEMLGQIIKELSGTGYGLLVGFEKMWPLVVAMCSIALVHIINVVLYLYYSRKKCGVVPIGPLVVLERECTFSPSGLSR